LADMHPAVNERCHVGGAAKLDVIARSLLKFEEGNPFYVLPVSSDQVFPQFKGPRNPGVVRVGCQQGVCLTASGSLALSDCPMHRANSVGSQSVPQPPASHLPHIHI